MKNHIFSVQPVLKIPKHSLLVLISIISCLLAPLYPATAQEHEQSEPKIVQKLHKCLDRQILKFSKKKQKSNASEILSKCRKDFERWLELLPEESHDTFTTQLTESVALALEEASKERLVADDDGFDNDY